jgi:hypothetical protein
MNYELGNFGLEGGSDLEYIYELLAVVDHVAEVCPYGDVIDCRFVFVGQCLKEA